jgi:DNA-binding NtrC family response regulator
MLVLLERILRGRTDYEVVATSNALEIPRLLSDQQFDVILCDLKMPGVSGLDILRRIREENRTEVVILITAFGTVETAEEALELGVFDYLGKPFKKETLLTSIERAVNWRVYKQDHPDADPILDSEPFEFASDVFRTAWVRQLSRRTGENAGDLARRCGLSEQEVKAALHQQAGGSLRPWAARNED